MGRLPEQLDANLATMGMLQQELRTVEESLLFARERQAMLTRGARSAAGETILTPGTRELTELQRQLTAISGRYTEDFLRFLSSRYAPVGAQNDPNGLNRFHAANLIAHYRKASRADG